MTCFAKMDTNSPGKAWCVDAVAGFCQPGGRGVLLQTVGGPAGFARHVGPEARALGYTDRGHIVVAEIDPTTYAALKVAARGTGVRVVLGDIFRVARELLERIGHLDADLVQGVTWALLREFAWTVRSLAIPTFDLVVSQRKDDERDDIGERYGIRKVAGNGNAGWINKSGRVSRPRYSHCPTADVLRAALTDLLPNYDLAYFGYGGACKPRADGDDRQRAGNPMACVMGRKRGSW